MKYFLYILFCVFFVVGCKKETAKTTEEKPIKPEMSIVVNHKKPKDLEPEPKEKLKEWKEYNEFIIFLKRFENISPNEALSNATELKTLIQELKNNLAKRKEIILENFDSDAFKARIDVLENEILRLYDMSLIPSITAKEVNLTVDKIYLIFGSLNAKINIMFKQKHYEENMKSDEVFELSPLEEKMFEIKEEESDIDISQ